MFYNFFLVLPQAYLIGIGAFIRIGREIRCHPIWLENFILTRLTVYVRVSLRLNKHQCFINQKF